MRHLFLFIGFIFCLNLVFPQGKLMIAGGGEEEQGGWSDLPYAWAISETKNKKIAIVGFKKMDRWLEAYFVKLGAKRIKTFQIETKESLNNQDLVDSLMNYDGWFLSGGHQADFYSYIKNSPLEAAIKQKYTDGGVISGSGGGAAILSEIIFTGQNGEAFSNACLSNIRHSSITLSNDFLPFLEGFIIETNFSKHGKIGRLISFMANWWQAEKENIAGIGLDEQTAICIDSAGIGKVYGSGATTLVLNDLSENDLVIKQSVPVLDSMRIVKLVQGNTFDFVSWEIGGFENYQRLPLEKRKLEYKLFLSGSNDLSDNQEFLDSLSYSSKSAEQKILIITRKVTSSVEAISVLLKTRGISETLILATEDPSTWEIVSPADIENIDKFLFLENYPDQLLTFFAHDQLGPTIEARLSQSGVTSGFIGDDSRLAGQVFIENHNIEGASGRGELVYREGFDLLSSAIITPNTFRNENYYENALTGAPYSMIKDSLELGLWLSGNSFVSYLNDGITINLHSYGSQPTLMLRNVGTKVGWAPKMNKKGKNIVGFEKMQLNLLDSLGLQLAESHEIEVISGKMKADWFSVYPNPFRENLNIFFYGSQSGVFTFQLLDSDGKEIKSVTKAIKPSMKFLKIPFPNLATGVYVLLVREPNQKIIKQIKVIH